MRMHVFTAALLVGCATVFLALGQASRPSNLQMDRDLIDTTVPQLQAHYTSGKYTVTQVAEWYLNRIERYDGLYNAVVTVDRKGALDTAAAQDAARKAAGRTFKMGALWGVPLVVKANTSVKGLVTNNGWEGYQIPGHELIAPKDAAVIEKLRSAGAVILGLTNLPDFAASDTTISSAGGRTGNAHNWRFSPGGSSGGTATAVAANFALLGTGTDTSNSIRLPAGANGVVGMLPTRGLVSITGIHPYDWLLDNVGPITRNVSDAAVALTVMAGEDPKDFRTVGSSDKSQPGPYSRYLRPDALKGKRFGVPMFIVREGPGGLPDGLALRPETRALFEKALDGLRSAGATVVLNSEILPESFAALTEDVNTDPYLRDGIERFLGEFGPAEYRSTAEYAKAVGSSIPAFFSEGPRRVLETDSQAEQNFRAPQRRAQEAYEQALDRFKLDGFVYPALQMPPNDETIPGRQSNGPHTRTGWANKIGVPAIVVPGGSYSNGLPFGLEFAARQWKDGDLLGFAYAYEQATQYRKTPVLTERP